MTDARWPTEADVARMREVYFSDGRWILSDVAIRIITADGSIVSSAPNFAPERICGIGAAPL